MTATGELYASEDCRDFAEKELDKLFGKGKWALDGSDWSDVWNTSQLPKTMEIPIVDDETHEEVLATLIVQNKFKIREDWGDRWVDTEPDTFKVQFK